MSISFVRKTQPNQCNERPQHVIFFDVESKLIKQDSGKCVFQPFLWTAIYKRYRKDNHKDTEQKYSGTDANDFWNMVDEKAKEKTKLYVVSHHLEVDFMPLGGFTALWMHNWKLKNIISHDRVVVLYCTKGTRSMVLMNNGNLFDGTVQEWGEVLGIAKLPMPRANARREVWQAYCMRDTEIVCRMWDNLLHFMDEHDLGNFRITRAGIALNAFRHRFMPTPIIIHNHKPTLDLERASYHGGRFEALKIGKLPPGHYYQLDVNSMYGYIEKNYKLPYELRGYETNPTPYKVSQLLKKYAVIAEVDVDISEPFIPVRTDTRVKYPTGKMTCTLCTPELEHAMSKGYVTGYKRVAWYKQDFVFQDFATYFLNLKQQYKEAGNKPMYAMAKFFPNALYGKFGQYGYFDQIIGDCNEDEFKIVQSYSIDQNTKGNLLYYSGKIHHTTRKDQGWYTFVAIASHITAYGRMMLFRLMNIAGFENVYHVACDSLLVNQMGYLNLYLRISDTYPGYLKLEKIYNSVTIKGVNDLVLDGQEKIKGIPKKAVKLGDNTYQITEWMHMNTLIEQGVLDFYYTRDVVKNLSRPQYHQSQQLTQ